MCEALVTSRSEGQLNAMSDLAEHISELLGQRGLTRLAGDKVESHGVYEEVLIEDVPLRGTIAKHLCCEHSYFRQVDLSKSRWDSVELGDVLVDNCQLSNAVWCNCRIERVALRRSQLTGFAAADGKFQADQFGRCKMNLSVFHDTHFVDCRFEKCDLREADFQGASIRRTIFRECDLRGARFPAVMLEEVDLRGSHLAGLDIESAALRSTIIDPSQLADVANILGLDVRNLDDDEGQR